MAVRPIVITGEPVLHRTAARVTVFDDAFAALVTDLWETLEASGGVGLAAPQIGVGQQVFVYDLDRSGEAGRGCVVNPVLQLGKVSQERPDPDHDHEGCLSVPGYTYPLRRPTWVRLDGLDERGERITIEAEDYLARCLQHETDHLFGRLYVDRLIPDYAKRAKKAIKREGWGRPGHSWMPGVDPDPFQDGED